MPAAFLPALVPWRWTRWAAPRSSQANFHCRLYLERLIGSRRTCSPARTTPTWVRFLALGFLRGRVGRCSLSMAPVLMTSCAVRMSWLRNTVLGFQWMRRCARRLRGFSRNTENQSSCQLTHCSPATRENSRTLRVTSVARWRNAVAAIKVSCGPIGVPKASSSARMRAACTAHSWSKNKLFSGCSNWASAARRGAAASGGHRCRP